MSLNQNATRLTKEKQKNFANTYLSSSYRSLVPDPTPCFHGDYRGRITLSSEILSSRLTTLIGPYGIKLDEYQKTKGKGYILRPGSGSRRGLRDNRETSRRYIPPPGSCACQITGVIFTSSCEIHL